MSRKNSDQDYLDHEFMGRVEKFLSEQTKIGRHFQAAKHRDNPKASLEMASAYFFATDCVSVQDGLYQYMCYDEEYIDFTGHEISGRPADSLKVLEKKYRERYVLWLTSAAKLGNIDAQNELSELFADGRMVERDAERAFYWEKKAAEQGDMNAQYDVGMSYLTGVGTTKDLTAAVSWFAKAAEPRSKENENNPYGAQHPRALYQLAKAYINGEGVEKDPVKAVEYLKTAAHYDDNKVYEKVPEKAWVNMDAVHLLSKCLFEGNGIAQDKQRGLQLLIAIRHFSSPEARFDLAQYYFKGDGVPRDYVQAADLVAPLWQEGNKEAKKFVAALSAALTTEPKTVQESAQRALTAKARPERNTVLKLG